MLNKLSTFNAVGNMFEEEMRKVKNDLTKSPVRQSLLNHIINQSLKNDISNQKREVIKMQKVLDGFLSYHELKNKYNIVEIEAKQIIEFSKNTEVCKKIGDSLDKSIPETINLGMKDTIIQINHVDIFGFEFDRGREGFRYITYIFEPINNHKELNVYCIDKRENIISPVARFDFPTDTKKKLKIKDHVKVYSEFPNKHSQASEILKSITDTLFWLCLAVELVKDTLANRETVYRVSKRAKTNNKRTQNDNNKPVARRTIEVLDKDKVIYTMTMDKTISDFKRTYTRRTQSWYVIPHERHLKDGRVIHIPGQTRGNRDIKPETKTYIIKGRK